MIKEITNVDSVPSAGTDADSSNKLMLIPSAKMEQNPMLAAGFSSSFWDFHIQQRKVEPLSKPCKDCAISTGFYIEIANELKKENKETIDAVVDTWFCHNNCNRGCAGVREYVKPCS